MSAATGARPKIEARRSAMATAPARTSSARSPGCEHEAVLEPLGQLQRVALIRSRVSRSRLAARSCGPWSMLARTVRGPRRRGADALHLANLVLLGDGGELGLGHRNGLDRNRGRLGGSIGGPSAARMRPKTTESTSACHDASMMFSDTPIVDQLPSASAVSRSTRVTGPGALRRVEDAHPVVGQVHVAQLAEMRLDGEAERGVEGVDGPVALGGGDDTLVADMDLDGRLGRELAR